jgi:hypothetical protein
MMKHILSLVCFLQTAVSAGAGWNYTYATNGTDWPLLKAPYEGAINHCGPENKKQSPINLLSPIGSYGWAYGLPIPKIKD